ncbi:hypothetical protein [Hespellia stercorisuis]|nr:hypothetical protein [Hespellia stercorisuis]
MQDVLTSAPHYDILSEMSRAPQKSGVYSRSVANIRAHEPDASTFSR